MFCLARIMLNEGLVNRVLLLCPSLTIETGLIDKFDDLLADSDLTALLPETKGTRLPERVDATQTVKEGHICIENIHAVYERTGSSIADSFEGHGASTLVLSDEAHHVLLAAGDAKLKKWKEFIASPAYGFRYHVGLSGTCYVGNEYFADVVYRYSIRDAINDRWVKDVFYVAKDESATDDERFQKLLAQHETNRKAYKPLKPLTIAVTKNIKSAEQLADDLVRFLAKQLPGKRAEAERKVLVVTSSPKHEKNVLRLRDRRRPDQPRRVGRLGCDALRGLGRQERLPDLPPREARVQLQAACRTGPRSRPAAARRHQRRAARLRLQPPALGPRSRGTRRRGSRPGDHHRAAPDATAARSSHFDLHRLTYKETPTGIEPRKVEKPKAIRQLNLRPQRDAPENTEFVSVSDSEQKVVLTTLVTETYYPMAEVVTDVRRRMKVHDDLTGGDLTKAYPKKRIEFLIHDALKRLNLKGTAISQENRQIIMSTFGGLRQTHDAAGRDLVARAKRFRGRLDERRWGRPASASAA